MYVAFVQPVISVSFSVSSFLQFPLSDLFWWFFYFKNHENVNWCCNHIFTAIIGPFLFGQYTCLESHSHLLHSNRPCIVVYSLTWKNAWGYIYLWHSWYILCCWNKVRDLEACSTLARVKSFIPETYQIWHDLSQSYLSNRDTTHKNHGVKLAVVDLWIVSNPGQTLQTWVYGINYITYIMWT